MGDHQCPICKMKGFWVAYDFDVKDYRCINHVGVVMEELDVD